MNADSTAFAVLAARAARSLLYGLEPWDPATLGLAVLAFALVSGLASWLPAHRAAGIEPKGRPARGMTAASENPSPRSVR